MNSKYKTRKLIINFAKKSQMPNQIELIKELKNLLISKYGDNIVHVILFGSRSIGNSSEYSDYDILIVLKSDYNWQYLRKVRSTIYDLAIEKNIITDTHFLSTSEIKNSVRAAQPIFINAMNLGIYA